jgi:antitoxin (DNA-binding transcriptional repressor) of toxin-antitoxin stability system
MIKVMATIHIPEADAARDFAALMAHVSAGSEVVIERDAHPVAIVRPPTRRPGRLLSESIAIAEARGSGATIDEEFARNVAEAIHAHREPLDPPAWD